MCSLLGLSKTKAGPVAMKRLISSLLHFKTWRANRGNQVSPLGSVRSKMLDLCQGHMAGPMVLGHYLASGCGVRL